MAARAGEHSVANITVPEGLEAIRLRPGLHAGSTDANGLLNLMMSVVGIAIDGGPKTIVVEVTGDGWITVEDDGDGLDLDRLMPVFTQLHGAPAFANADPRNALNRFGCSTVNALSARLEVTTHHRGRAWSVTFKQGHVVERLRETSAKRGRGTTIRFRPDPTIFGEARLALDNVGARLRDLAAMLPRVAITLQGAPLGASEGISAIVRSMHHFAPETLLSGSEATRDLAIDFAIAWSSELGAPKVRSFVNLLEEPRGGSHVDGIWLGIAAAAPSFALKVASRRSLVVAVHARVEGTSVNAPLASDEARDSVSRAVERALRAAPWWWDRVGELMRRG